MIFSALLERSCTVAAAWEKTDSKEQDVKKLLRVYKNKSENLLSQITEGIEVEVIWAENIYVKITFDMYVKLS